MKRELRCWPALFTRVRRRSKRARTAAGLTDRSRSRKSARSPFKNALIPAGRGSLRCVSCANSCVARRRRARRRLNPRVGTDPGALDARGRHLGPRSICCVRAVSLIFRWPDPLCGNRDLSCAPRLIFIIHPGVSLFFFGPRPTFARRSRICLLSGSFA